MSRSNKRGVSAMVAYVMLISITIALSVLVYNWLSFYVEEDNIPECPSSVDVIIKSYDCVKTSVAGGDGYLNVTLKNKGLHSVDGFMLRVNDREGANLGIYVLNDSGGALMPGAEFFGHYNFTEPYPYGANEEKILEEITLLEVQPFLMEGEQVSCRSRSSQDIVCS